MTHMLQSECCGNYLCHFCAQDMWDREEKVASYVPRCLFNCTLDFFILIDVPNQAELKKYTDSQILSVYSKTMNEMKVYKDDSAAGTIRKNKSYAMISGTFLSDDFGRINSRV